MRNLYREFLALIPDPALQVGTVVSVQDGIVLVELPGGARLSARGDATAGQPVFVRGGVIEGSAPSLPLEMISV